MVIYSAPTCTFHRMNGWRDEALRWAVVKAPTGHRFFMVSNDVCERGQPCDFPTVAGEPAGTLQTGNKACREVLWCERDNDPGATDGMSQLRREDGVADQHAIIPGA